MWSLVCGHRTGGYEEVEVYQKGWRKGRREDGVGNRNWVENLQGSGI
jgi:hypothetical protein